jgi:hypothetical protein
MAPNLRACSSHPGDKKVDSTAQSSNSTTGFLARLISAEHTQLLQVFQSLRLTLMPYQGGYLLHYLDKLVYPDISATALTLAGVIVCGMNLAFYGRQAWLAIRSKD